VTPDCLNIDLDSSSIDINLYIRNSSSINSNPSFMDLDSSITDSDSSKNDHEDLGKKSSFHSPKIRPGKLFELPQINQNIFPLPQINTECSTKEKKVSTRRFAS